MMQSQGNTRLRFAARISAPERECAAETSGQRAYFRVSGTVPIRVTPLAPEEVGVTVFELSMPTSLVDPIALGEEEDSPLTRRLRRIEEKLDLLLGEVRPDVPRPLGGHDCQPIVFSGSGFSIEYAASFRKGDCFRVEILLPAPYSRVVVGVGRAVRDTADPRSPEVARLLPVELTDMRDEDRADLVAYSYDLQRVELRARDRQEACV